MKTKLDFVIKYPFDFPLKLETLENLSPAVLSSVGMLCMNTSDVNWPLLVDRWLAKRSEREADPLRELCDRYIGPTLAYLASKTSVPPISGVPPTQNKPSKLRHVVPVSEMGMVNTLLTLVEVGLWVVCIGKIFLLTGWEIRTLWYFIFKVYPCGSVWRAIENWYSWWTGC